MTLPQNGWQPQNLKIVPTTNWSQSQSEYGLQPQVLVAGKFSFDLPPGATCVQIALVAARLCGKFEMMNIMLHNGACGGTITGNIYHAPPIDLYGYCAPGDLMYGVISIHDTVPIYADDTDASGKLLYPGVVVGFQPGTGLQTSYSAPFQFQQPLGVVPAGVPFVPFDQTPGINETDYCKNVVSIRMGGSVPVVSTTPTTTTVAIKGHGKK